EPLVEDRVRIVDLAAARAGEIAAKQRLQHQHERIVLAPEQTLLDQVGADTELFEKRDGHNGSFLIACDRFCVVATVSRSLRFYLLRFADACGRLRGVRLSPIRAGAEIQ